MKTRNLYNKANAPYIIAGALATLTLLASGVFAISPYVAFLSTIAAFNVALPVALSLSVLSALVLVLSYKVITKNKEMEDERSKFAEKEQELENEITLEKESRKAVNGQVEELNNQLNKSI